jgi:Domain of unknown function (DUF5666)
MKLNLRRSRLVVVGAALLFLATALGGFAQAMTTVTSVDGTISAVKGDTITLTTADKMQKTISLGPNTLVLMRQVATLDEIKSGDAMGVASRRASDGSLTAISINIFSPELYKVVRKGEFPMQTGDTMTNALVTKYAKSVQGRMLTMTYAEGTSTITVPESAQIHRLVTVKKPDLAVGLHINVRGTVKPDGTVQAQSVSYDKA